MLITVALSLSLLNSPSDKKMHSRYNEVSKETLHDVHCSSVPSLLNYLNMRGKLKSGFDFEIWVLHVKVVK